MVASRDDDGGGAENHDVLNVIGIKSGRRALAVRCVVVAHPLTQINHNRTHAHHLFAGGRSLARYVLVKMSFDLRHKNNRAAINALLSDQLHSTLVTHN